MASIRTCPDEHELLPVATGEPAVEGIEAHLAGCPDCRDRVERLRAELTALRRDFESGVIPPSTEPDPTVNPDGKPSSDGTTLDWTSDPVETAAPEPLGPEAVAATREHTERPGAVGKYLVVDQLDEGGQGLVFRVIHPRLGRDMVLKLGRQPVGEDEHASLVAEGRLLADLEHINLVKIYDLDFYNDRPFLVMEYVHGRNLEDYARDEPVTPRRAAEVVAKLAGALAMVHRRGIIHRDIKPRNILIDESGEPRLIDFGLARLRHAWSDRPDPTWGGTLAYMAPEQARLEHDRIGPRSDVFGLGAVLYFLLTGQPPFVGETTDELWDRAKRCDFEKDALRLARVPRGLRRICLTALAADPADRYPSAAAFEKALNRYLILPIVQVVLSGVCALAVVGPLVLNHVWPRPDPTPSQSPLVVIQTAPPAPGLPKPAALRVESFQVALHRQSQGDPAGRIGTDAFAGRVEQDVRVQVQLSIPAHCFLIALNPNGTIQLCYPQSPEVAPVATSTIDYPSDPLTGFGLTDGAGTQAFVLVASAQPLPAYREWTRKLGDLSWKPAPIENVWQYNGRSFGRDTPRGEVRPLSDLPPSLEAACRALRAGPGVEAIQALAFPVQDR